LIQHYIEATWRRWLSQQGTAQSNAAAANLIDVRSRVWFNEEVESRAALIPGSLAVIMTLIGTMLTSLVVAREWERGTMEALLSTPVTRGDLFLCKFVPYFLLGIMAMILVTVISTWGLDVPLRGSFWALLMVTSAFLAYALGLGLLISVVAGNQFVATQGALIAGFLPAFILSGLVFEINSMPWPIRFLTYLFAPRYFVSSLRTLFLAGDVWQIIAPNVIVMTLLGAVFLIITARKMPITLETGK
jgi:ABC-2 type transport system permease protein